MKSFLKTLLAALLANVIVIAAILFAVVVFAFVASKGKQPKVETGSVLLQAISGSIPEYSPPDAINIFGDGVLSHTAILENLEKARHDKRVRAVVLRIESPGLGFAKMDELQERIRQLRRAGKPVIAYTEMLSNGSLYLGSTCDSLLFFRNGYVSLHGFASERPFIKGALEKLGIKDNLHRIEKYKSAAEIIQRKEMSQESRDNLDWMLDAYYPNFVRTIEEGRGLEPGDLERRALSAGALVPAEVAALHLVDRLVYWDEVEASLLRIPGVKERGGSRALGPRPRIVRGPDYAKISRGRAGIKGKKKIAVVHAQGMIGGEKSGSNLLFGMTMGAGTMEDAFRQAVANDDVAGIVFRVDSGGGESSTSWRIGHAAARAAAMKPMVVSMVDMAASGAYMISYPCTTLVADRLSVVGSIGSISGKFNMKGFYDKLGLTKDFATRGPNGLMDSDYSDYTPEQYDAFVRSHWADYYEWVDDVARVRGLTRAAIDSVGRGRVWTGEQALQRGLIDTLGTFDTAVQIVKQRAGIPANQEVSFIHYPKPPGILDALREGSLPAAAGAIVRYVAGPFRQSATWAVDLNDYRP